MFVFTERGRIVARRLDVHLERHAQHFHSVRADEDQSSLLDANDYQIQGQSGRGQVA